MEQGYRLYQDLTFSGDWELGEEGKSYGVVTEKHLQAIWLEQRYFRPLRNGGGKLIRVIHPGQWNHGSGPDFLAAHLWIGEEEFKGDVEVHFQPQQWFQHGHERDPAFNNVVLHVCLSPGNSELVPFCENGIRPCPIYLENFLLYPLQELLRRLDLDFYPHPRFGHAGSCSKTLFSSEEDGKHFLESAALWRLQKKWDFLAAHVGKEGQRFSAGMAMALGYSKNPDSFLRLFLHLWPLRHRPFNELYARALSACGLFAGVYQKKWGEDPLYRQMEALASGMVSAVHFPLVISRSRPANHPLRRLAALILWIQGSEKRSSLSNLQTLWQACWPRKKWKVWFKECEEIRPDLQHPYWSFHYSFGKESSRPVALFGPRSWEEGLLNTFFPLLYEEILRRGNVEEEKALRDLLRHCKPLLSEKANYLSFRFFPEEKGSLDSAILVQGAYQLHRDLCSQYGSSCVGCPLALKPRVAPYFPIQDLLGALDPR